ncbi:hypothetical protein NXS19_005563 [Fusarium pseudograminearum]|nr:hypothetical protein NXS19_005563 [Fusarium pseudograminearum]
MNKLPSNTCTPIPIVVIEIHILGDEWLCCKLECSTHTSISIDLPESTSPDIANLANTPIVEEREPSGAETWQEEYHQVKIRYITTLERAVIFEQCLVER